MSSASFGKLYIVATPIGNLSDITLRALDVLKQVNLIISEDTRETSKLLNKYNISASQISYRDQNHSKVYPKILEIIKSGQDVALVSDSGTPLISDPGFKLVNQVLSNKIEVESIPGPSSVISSLVSSGLPTDKFCFIGFLPKSTPQRLEILKKYGELDATLTIFESPYRLLRLLEEVLETLGNRQACASNEITKLHEKTIRGNLKDLSTHFNINKPKGEYVLLVAKKGFKND